MATKAIADKQRFDVVNCHYSSGMRSLKANAISSAVRLLHAYMGITGPDFDPTRRFAALALANLTMSEDCKEDLLRELGFEFFLNFPQDMIAQRNAALCLSELFEEAKNQQIALSGGASLTKLLLETLRGMSGCGDSITEYLAVKSLALLTQYPGNIERLLYNGTLEIFFEFSQRQVTSSSFAWEGMKNLAGDKATLLRYGERGPPRDMLVVDDLIEQTSDFYQIKCSEQWEFPSVRLNVPITTVGKYYYECTVITGGLLQLGVADASWAPSGHGHGVGDDACSYGVDGSRGCGWFDGSNIIPPQTMSWSAGSVIGVVIDVNAVQNKQHVSFLIDGVNTGLSLPASSNWVFGVVLACSFNSLEEATFNIGGSAFAYPVPEGCQSLLQYARSQHIRVPQFLEVWEADSARWTPIAESHDLMNMCNVGKIERLRMESVTWLLFIETMNMSDDFFTKPIALESPHPNTLSNLKKVVSRTGASAFQVTFDKLKFSKAVGSAESIQLYSDASCESLAHKISGTDPWIAPFLVVSEEMAFCWSSGRSAGESTNNGWGYQLKIAPKFGKLDIADKAKTQSLNGGVSVKYIESDHNYDNNMDLTEHVELEGATAIRIVFDPMSNTESGVDYLSFFLDEACTIPVAGAQRLSGRNFPGLGEVPPLVIEAGQFWYKFYSDASVNEWGYKFECSSCKPLMEELMEKPGAVKLDSMHPYVNTGKPEGDVALVSVRGRYHSCVYFSQKCELSPGDVLDILLSDPAIDMDAKPYMSFTETNFPKSEVFVPSPKFWVRFVSSSGTGNCYGYEMVAYRGFDLFTAAVASAGAVVIETPHPYDNDSDIKYPINIASIEPLEGVRKVAVAFDTRSATESNYDYITFLSAEEGGTTYGEDKYSGGRDGSSKNFPTVDLPLHIEHAGTDTFYAAFHSDSSNNDWGVRIVIYNPQAVESYDPLLDVEVVEERKKKALSKRFSMNDQMLAFVENSLDHLLVLCRTPNLRIKTLAASIICNVSMTPRRHVLVNNEVFDVLNALLSNETDPWLHDVLITVTKNIIGPENKAMLCQSGVVGSVVKAWVSGMLVADAFHTVNRDTVLDILRIAFDEVTQSSTIMDSLVDILKISEGVSDGRIGKYIGMGLELLTTQPMEKSIQKSLDASLLGRMLSLLTQSTNSDLLSSILVTVSNICQEGDNLVLFAHPDNVVLMENLFSLLLYSNESIQQKASSTIAVLVSKNKASKRGSKELLRLSRQYLYHSSLIENRTTSSADGEESKSPEKAPLKGEVGSTQFTFDVSELPPASWETEVSLEGTDQSYQSLFKSKFQTHSNGVVNTDASGYLHRDVESESGMAFSMWLYVGHGFFETDSSKKILGDVENDATLFQLGGSGKGKKMSLMISRYLGLVLTVPYQSNEGGELLQAKLAADACLTEGTWSHVAFSVDTSVKESIRASLFVSGQRVAATVVDSALFNLSTLMSSPWSLGHSAQKLSNKKKSVFNGAIVDVRVFNRPFLRSSESGTTCADALLLDALNNPPEDEVALNKIFANAQSIVERSVMEISNLQKLPFEQVQDQIFTLVETLLLLTQSDACASFFVNGQLEGKTMMSYILKLAKDGQEVLYKLPSGDDGEAIFVESEHPYPNSMSGDTPLELSWEGEVAEGVKGLKIWFDPRSSSERNVDYVQFYASENTDSIIGGKYTGGFNGSDKNYPTKENPLIIPHLKVWVRFFSDFSDNDWGWKIFAVPTSESDEIELGDLFRIHESAHPYEANADTYHRVFIPEATELEIFFGPETQTEPNYDYVTIYKDATHTEYWGEEKYSGGSDGSMKNFPTHRNPLRIPANSFEVHFKSDGR